MQRSSDDDSIAPFYVQMVAMGRQRDTLLSALDVLGLSTYVYVMKLIYS